MIEFHGGAARTDSVVKNSRRLQAIYVSAIAEIGATRRVRLREHSEFWSRVRTSPSPRVRDEGILFF